MRIKLGFKILNVAKCNLGKVKLQANAVSGLLLQRTLSLAVSFKNFKNFPCFRVFFDLNSLTDINSGVNQNACRVYCLITPLYLPLSLPCHLQLLTLQNKTLIFHDFQGPTFKFHDFPGLENEILTFHDFPVFP